MSVAAGARLHKASARTPAILRKPKQSCAQFCGANKLFFLLQVCVLIFIINVTESVERSKHGCIVCGKKSQRTPFHTVDSVQSNANLEGCFGYLEKTSGDICETCRKVLQQYRNNGKTFHHVSVFLMFNFFNLTYTCDVKIKIERCCMQLELQKYHIFIDSAELYL